VRQRDGALVRIAGRHDRQRRPLGMKLRGRLEELVEIASGYELVVGRAFQRHDVSNRRDGPGRFSRPWRAAWHGLPLAGVAQCTAAYITDSSVASVPEKE
jgi:hypothetical protein